MPRLFKKSQKYNVARNCFLARIVLLDKTTIEFNLLPEVTGTDCLEKVAQVMEIQEVSWWSIKSKILHHTNLAASLVAKRWFWCWECGHMLESLLVYCGSLH